MTRYLYAFLFFSLSSLIVFLSSYRKKNLSSFYFHFGIPVIAALSIGFALGMVLSSLNLQIWSSKLINTLQYWQSQSPPFLHEAFNVFIRWAEILVGPPKLEATLVLTILFLMVYVAARLTYVVLWTVFSIIADLILFIYRLIRRIIFGVQPASLKANPFPAMLPSQAGFLEPSVNWAILFSGIGFMAIPWTAHWPKVESYWAALFWAGVWISVLEVRSWLGARSPGAGMISGEDVGVETIEPIRDLFYEYQRRHPGQILLAWDEPARQIHGRSPEYRDISNLFEKSARKRFSDSGLNDHQIDRLAGALQLYLDGGNLVFKETLSRLHFVLFSELILILQQRGGVILILCPDGSETETVNAISAHFTPTLLSRALRFVTIGHEPFGADINPDVVVCSDSGLEEFLNNQVFFKISIQLRLIIALGIERISLSDMRCQLVRLCMRQGDQTVQLLFQTEAYVNAEAGIREIAPFRPFLECSLNPNITSQRYLLVWDIRFAYTQAEREFYVGAYDGHIDSAMLLCWLPWDRGFGVSYLDEAMRLDYDLVERIRTRISIHLSGRQARPSEWMQLDQTRLGYVEPENLVFVTEDLCNLSAAVYHNYNFDTEGSAIICVVSSNYLLRDFILACFHGQHSRGTFRLSDEMLMPRFPLARTSITDLAMVACDAMSSDAGFSEVEWHHLLINFSPHGLLDGLGIVDSFQGLKNLLDEVFGREALSEVRLLERENRFFIDGSAPILCEKFQLIDSHGTIKGHVHRSGVGLLLAAGVAIQLDGKFHHINKIDEKNKCICVTHFENDRSKRFRTFFMRFYRIEEFVDYEGDKLKIVHGKLKLEIAHRNAHLSRTSTGYCQVSEMLRPLDAEETASGNQYSFKFFDHPITCGLKWRNVFELKILCLNNSEHSENLANLAFTICALLQDTIYSLFPLQAQYIAVFSPQSNISSTTRYGINSSDDLPIMLYPQLDTTSPDEGHVSENTLTIYVVEDGHKDLGVVRSIRNGFKAILNVVYAYLNWALQQEEKSLYHTFGNDKLHPMFDYATAKTLLERLFSYRKPPHTAKRPEIKIPEIPERQNQALKECDFCAAPIEGVSEELMPDGRHRCKNCGATAIDQVQGDFIKLYNSVLKKMTQRYHIKLPTGIRTRTTNPSEIAARIGESFIPTDGFDPRTVGLAVPDNQNPDQYEILIENGAPRIAAMATLAHEFTHIWQFQFLNKIARKNNEKIEEIMEGQARFIEIEFMKANDGQRLAQKLEAYSRIGNDIYARGWRKVNGICNYSPATIFKCFEIMLKDW